MKSAMRVLLPAVLILLVPLVAMQFSDEVDWDLRDFVVVGAILVAAGLVYEFGVRRLANPAHRVLGGLALAGVVFLMWAELAVGVFGSPFAGS